MLVLITYDVNTSDAEGRRRLQKISKKCVRYGQRVQNSVFECLLDPTQLKQLQSELLRLMDKSLDSLRFYNLGNQYHSRIEHFGVKESYMPDDTLIL